MRFATFAPIMLAGIGRMAATIEDRSVQVVLRRRRSDELCERFRHDQTDHLQELAQRASRWAADHLQALAVAEPAVPALLGDRAADNWRTLLAIADELAPEWGRRARDAAEALAQIGTEEAINERLIHDIGTILAAKDADRIPSQELAASLAELEGSAWAEWRGSMPLSKYQLARLLRPFGIQPATIRIGNKTQKGYIKAQFQDTFARYASSCSLDRNFVTQPRPEAQNRAEYGANRRRVTR
jgi:hypothetical protein